jgi:hypothetical protein
MPRIYTEISMVKVPARRQADNMTRWNIMFGVIPISFLSIVSAVDFFLIDFADLHRNAIRSPWIRSELIRENPWHL